jgi:hypothetical protein
LKYYGQLKSHNSFNLHPPTGFSPWSDRILIELRRRLKAHGQTAKSLHRAAELLDGHLDAISEQILCNADLRMNILDMHQSSECVALITNATNVQELRATVCNLDLFRCKNSRTANLVDVPRGWYEVVLFVKISTLALSKIAAAIDATDDDQRLSLMLEAMSAGALAIAVDDAEKDLEREIQNMNNTNRQTADQIIESKI